MTSKEILLRGAAKLEPILVSQGFQFEFCGEGKSSGGGFAWGRFLRGERILDLHVRDSLGLVSYHIGKQGAGHESYMRELEVSERCSYPGFPGDPLDAFDRLAHDLTFAEDFLIGNGSVLQRAAEREAAEIVLDYRKVTAGYLGDVRRLERLRESFRRGEYAAVISAANEIEFPELMTESQHRIVQIARERVSVS